MAIATSRLDGTPTARAAIGDVERPAMRTDRAALSAGKFRGPSVQWAPVVPLPLRGASNLRSAICWTLVCFVLAPALAPAAQHTHAPKGHLLSSRCERPLDDGYETRGGATIDRVGDRYVLTVRCDGVHQIYARSATLALERFVGKPVRARYRYVDEDNPRTRCVRAPCPPASERVLDITGLDEIEARTPDPLRAP